MAPSHKEILRRTIEALEVSLRRYPQNEKILLQLAHAYSGLGRFDPRAFTVYQQASVLFPADVKLQRALSIAYLINQSAEILHDVRSIEDLDLQSVGLGIDRLLKVSREFPDSPYVHRALGDLQLLRGEEREAIQHYRVAMALGLGELDSLTQHYEQVRRLRALSAGSAVFFAELYQRLGRTDIANDLYEEWIRRPIPEPYILEKYGDFLQACLEDCRPGMEAEQARLLRQLSRYGLIKGSLGEAMSAALRLPVESLCIDNKLAKDLARRLMAVEDFRQAFDYLSNIPLDEEAKSLLNEMTVLLEKRGELDTVVYILQYINQSDDIQRQTVQVTPVKSNQDDLQIEIETELQMAELHWKNKRWDQAFERYLRVMELGYTEYRSILEPLDLVLTRVEEVTVRQLAFMVVFFAERREWRRVLIYALRVLNDDPANTAMSQRVLQACERILIENPNDHEVRLIHGDELLRTGSIERAMHEYRRCAEAPEYKMKATRRLAMAYFRAGDLNGTFEHFRTLPVLEVEDLERLYDLGLAFSAAQKYKEAFECMKAISEYDPKFRDLPVRYAEYEEKMNQGNVGLVIDPKMRELIGDHSIGRYKYIAKIGSGGMGVVHKVMDLKVGQVVAMKILREGLSSSGKAIDRFFREARIAATLHHKNIVNILDYNISNNYGQSYIAMEFVDGPSLREVIEKKFSQTIDISNDDILEALDWISQLCDALDATHKKGIIHRDIKPDNLMLASDSMLKVTDFGIVHIEEATFTPTGALIGTPRYMSPEQVHGGRIDGRSDIYAVGIILYELLIGSPPFISGDISYQQVNVLPTPPREICPVIPPQVDRIILKCLEKSAADRYQSALECKKDIDETYMRLGGDPLRRKPQAGAAPATTPPRPATPHAKVVLSVPAISTPPPIRQVSPLVPTVEEHPRPAQIPPSNGEDGIETPASFLLPNRKAQETREFSSPRSDNYNHEPLDSELD